MKKLRRCWVCGTEHYHKSKYCSRFCLFWAKKNFKKKEGEIKLIRGKKKNKN